jgi:hypothetical protein
MLIGTSILYPTETKIIRNCYTVVVDDLLKNPHTTLC